MKYKNYILLFLLLAISFNALDAQSRKQKGLFKLAKESLDPKIAAWSLKASAILVKIPEAIDKNDQDQLVELYSQIGNLVKNPPQSCDNTLAEAA